MSAPSHNIANTRLTVGGPESRLYQITCWPISSTIPIEMRLVFHVGWSNTVERVTLALGRLSRLPPVPIHWHHPSGPHFGNMLGLLTLDGRSARIRLHRSTGSAAKERANAGSDIESSRTC